MRFSTHAKDLMISTRHITQHSSTEFETSDTSIEYQMQNLREAHSFEKALMQKVPFSEKSVDEKLFVKLGFDLHPKVKETIETWSKIEEGSLKLSVAKPSPEDLQRQRDAFRMLPEKRGFTGTYSVT
ncbi:hypothetical protein [Simkania sp.]|uniref:hypothetical protein n=1 Tax=Simkania sp. TaxID=34094 RepID=UPI003B5298D1